MVMREPFAVRQAQGIAAAGRDVQQRPVGAAAQAVRMKPSVPTVRAVGVLAAVPVRMAPLPVMQDLKINAEAALAGVSAVVVLEPA